jgi:5,10-methylenetetrahydrofolate reductase
MDKQMSSLADKLRSGQFVITSELSPPKGTDTSALEATAALLSGHIDAFNLTDSAASKMSLSPLSC